MRIALDSIFNSSSIKSRFLVSVCTNIARAVLSFVSGVLIARALNPAGYGELTFLLGSFVAIRSLLDLGSSSAFFTFLSQGKDRKQQYHFYFTWLGIQACLSILVILLIIPQNILNKIWLGNSRDIVFLAFLGSFLQQQVWQTVVQIGESARKTIKVQILNIGIASFHLFFIYFLILCGYISVKIILSLTICEYVIAVLCAIWFIRSGEKKYECIEKSKTLKPRNIIFEYWAYCKPLLLLSIVGFLDVFGDRWMLQKFGGNIAQGLYQISYQFSSVILLATSSIINIFWKEIAEAYAKNDLRKAHNLYRHVLHLLVMGGAVSAGFLIPWTGDIVLIILGHSFVSASPVMAIMFLYPVHLSMGQLASVMLLAKQETKLFAILSYSISLTTILITYFVLAPTNSGYLISGLGLGALGMSLKMVVINIISVNVLAYTIAVINKWKYEWLFQVVGIALFLTLGYLVKTVIEIIFTIPDAICPSMIFIWILAGVIYIILTCFVFWNFPQLIAMERIEIKRHISMIFRRRSFE